MRSSRRNGKRFIVSRRYGEPPIVRDAGGAVSNFTPADLLPNIEIYGQNEIYEIAQNAENQLMLIDRFLPIELVDMQAKLEDVEKFEKKFGFEEKRDEKQSLLPCKPTTRWEDVKITLIENEVVRVKTPRGTERFSYHDLGMSDKRSGNKPTVLWVLFKTFAQNKGVISSKNFDYDPMLPDTAKRLNKHLKEVFGIDESIYSGHYKSQKGYKTKIFFSDQTQVI